jgi:hypothetical protein
MCRWFSSSLPIGLSFRWCTTYCNHDPVIQSEPFCQENYCANNLSALELGLSSECQEFCEGQSKYERQCNSYCESPSARERPFCRIVSYCNDTQFQSRPYCHDYCDDPLGLILLPECRDAVTVERQVIHLFSSLPDIMSRMDGLPPGLMDDATATALGTIFVELNSSVVQFVKNNQQPNLSDDPIISALNPNFSKSLREDLINKVTVAVKMTDFRQSSLEWKNRVVAAYQNGKYETVLFLFGLVRDIITG